MAIPSFDELLSQARQLAEENADYNASVRRGTLLAKGLSDVAGNILGASTGERKSYVGAVSPEGQYAGFDRPLQTGGTVTDVLFRKLFSRGEEQPQIPRGSFPVTQEQLGEKALSNVFKPKKTYMSAEPAIATGYASRDFVKQIVPNFPDDQDISIGELQSRIKLFKEEKDAKRPKSIPSEQLTQVSKFFEGLELNRDIRNQYFGLVSKGKSPVDPISGRWTDLQQSIGLLNDQDVAKFMADLSDQFNTYLNNLSGAAISPEEAERLKKRINNTMRTPAQFLGTLDSVDNELKRKFKVRIKILKAANYNVGELENLIKFGESNVKEGTQTGGLNKTSQSILEKYGVK